MENSNKKKLARSDSIFIALLLLYPLLNFIVFYVVVNFNSILMAFQKTDTSTFRSVWAGFDNFERFFRDLTKAPQMGLYIRNALSMFITTLGLGMPFNMFFAYMFFIKIKGTTAYRMAIMIPSMISGLVTAMLFSKFAENAMPILFEDWFGIKTISLLRDNRYNYATVVVYALLTGFSSNVIIYCNAMNAASDSLVEVAQLEGASHLQTLWYLGVPTAYPTITTFMVTGVSGLFACGGGIQYLFYEYDAPDTVTTLGYYVFTMTKNNDASMLDYSYSSAIGLIFTVVTLPLVMGTKYLMEKYDPNREEGVK